MQIWHHPWRTVQPMCSLLLSWEAILCTRKMLQ
jgi:hypothetical protein